MGTFFKALEQAERERALKEQAARRAAANGEAAPIAPPLPAPPEPPVRPLVEVPPAPPSVFQRQKDREPLQKEREPLSKRASVRESTPPSIPLVDAHLVSLLAPTSVGAEARVMFDKLIAEDPRDAEALSGRAEIARWDGDYETASRLMHNALAATPDRAANGAEGHDVLRRAAQMRAARRGPILPLVLGLIAFSVLVASLSRVISLRTYTVLVGFTVSAVGLSLSWLYLVHATAPRR
jgi:hypothetical protein